jgi:hypothetical protein
MDDPQGGPRRVAGDPAIGDLDDQRGVAGSVAPAVALELDRAVRDDGADLRRGRNQAPRISASQIIESALTQSEAGVNPRWWRS